MMKQFQLEVRSIAPTSAIYICVKLISIILVNWSKEHSSSYRRILEKNLGNG